MEIQTQATGDPRRDPHCCAFTREGKRSETHILPKAPPPNLPLPCSQNPCAARRVLSTDVESQNKARVI